jgi:hypothetical protein
MHNIDKLSWKAIADRGWRAANQSVWIEILIQAFALNEISATQVLAARQTIPSPPSEESRARFGEYHLPRRPDSLKRSFSGGTAPAHVRLLSGLKARPNERRRPAIARKPTTEST